MIGRKFRVYHNKTNNFEMFTVHQGHDIGKYYLVSDYGIVYCIGSSDKLNEKDIAKYILELKSDCDDVTTWDGNETFGRKVAV